MFVPSPNHNLKGLGFSAVLNLVVSVQFKYLKLLLIIQIVYIIDFVTKFNAVKN